MISSGLCLITCKSYPSWSLVVVVHSIKDAMEPGSGVVAERDA